MLCGITISTYCDGSDGNVGALKSEEMKKTLRLEMLASKWTDYYERKNVSSRETRRFMLALFNSVRIFVCLLVRVLYAI